jgi:uncharacterized protein
MIEALENFKGLNVTINTNEDCNLACKYCYEVNKKHRVLDINIAKKFIDLILTTDDLIGVKGTDKDWMLNQGLILDFIGGDSLMHPELVDELLRYFSFKAIQLNHKWKSNWRASLSTNGTLFERQDVRDMLVKWKNNLSVGVSIDGCPELHDKNRIYLDGTGSLATIMKWWPWFIDTFGDGARRTKSTLSKDSIPYIYDSLVFMHEIMGIKWISQNFIMEDMHLTEDDLKLLDEQLDKCYKYVLQHNDDLYWSMLGQKNILSYEESCKSHPNSGYCGAGCMPTLSVNGKIYPCFRFLPHTSNLDLDFNIGNVEEGLTNKHRLTIVQEQTREKISPEKCKTCDCESLCSWCIGGAYSENGIFYRTTSYCEVTKLRAKYSRLYWKAYENIQTNSI